MTAHPIVAFAREALGFDLSARQAGILDEIYRDRIRTAVLRLGRRAGKGRIAAVVGAYEATVNAPAHLAAVPEGEQVAIVIVSQSQRLARVVHRYIAGFLRKAGQTFRETLDEIELGSGIVVLTLPCHSASARGLAVAVAILDEVAHWQGRDGSPLDPAEVWNGLVPATAQFTEGRVLALSTPRWRTDFFARLVELAASGKVAGMRAWHASTADMNPRIPAAFLDAERARDPESFAREYLAEFASGVGAVFDAALVRAAVRQTVESSSRGGIGLIAVDAAFTGDTFALVAGHLDLYAGGQGRIVVDRTIGWRGNRADPVRLDPTLDAIADLARAMGGVPVVIDQFAAEPIRQGLVARGVEVLARPWGSASKVDAVAAVRRFLYAGSLELPADDQLVAELCGLEQRPTPGGRPRIAASPGGRDDFASALMALVAEFELHLVAEPETYLDVDLYERLVAMGCPEGEATRLALTDHEPAMVSISPF